MFDRVDGGKLFALHQAIEIEPKRAHVVAEFVAAFLKGHEDKF